MTIFIILDNKFLIKPDNILKFIYLNNILIIYFYGVKCYNINIKCMEMFSKSIWFESKYKKNLIFFYYSKKNIEKTLFIYNS